MTYLAKPVLTPEGAFITPSFSGGLTANTALDLSLSDGSITGMTTGATSLTLGPGHYMVSFSLGVNRNSTDDTLTLDWLIREGGAQIGSKGGIDNQSERVMGCDVANACFTVLEGSTKVLDFVINNNTNNAMTVEPDYSYILIWRSDL